MAAIAIREPNGNRDVELFSVAPYDKVVERYRFLLERGDYDCARIVKEDTKENVTLIYYRNNADEIGFILIVNI